MADGKVTVDTSGAEKKVSLLKDALGGLENMAKGLGKAISDAFDVKSLDDFISKAMDAAVKAGDPAGVAGEYTSQMAELNSGFEELQMTVGEALLPIANEVLPSINDVLSAFNGLVETVKPGLSWLWDNFLQPIAGWTGGAVTTVLERLTGILQKVGDWIGKNKGAVEGMAVTVAAFFAAWKGVELAEFLINAGGVSGILGKMATGLKNVTIEKIKDKVETLKLCALYIKDWAVAMAANVVSIGKDIAAWIALRVEWISGKLHLISVTAAEVAHTVASNAAALATAAFGAAMAILTSPITLVVLAIGALIAIVVLLVTHWDQVKAAAEACWAKLQEVWAVVSQWFNDTVVTPIKEFFTGLWDGVKEAASACWTKLQEVWAVVSQWFNDTVVAPIQGFFTGLWDGIKDAASNCWTKVKEFWTAVSQWFNETVVIPLSNFFSGLWTGIANWAAEAWTGIKETFAAVAGWFDEHLIQPITTGFKSFVNGLIGFVESFVNFFVRGINRVIEAANTLSFTAPDWLGGGTFGINIPKVPELKLPRLATGAVIPPNRAFMAVLGDQRSGTNLEAPEALIRKIVREESGGGAVVPELREILAAIREGKVLMVDKRVLGATVRETLSAAARAGGAVPVPVR